MWTNSNQASERERERERETLPGMNAFQFANNCYFSGAAS
jgi:hypothetical protein